MINIKHAIKNDRLMRAVIGMGLGEFSALLKKFAPLAKRIPYKRNRRRKSGAGRTHIGKSRTKTILYSTLHEVFSH